MKKNIFYIILLVAVGLFLLVGIQEGYYSGFRAFSAGIASLVLLAWLIKDISGNKKQRK